MLSSSKEVVSEEANISLHCTLPVKNQCLKVLTLWLLPCRTSIFFESVITMSDFDEPFDDNSFGEDPVDAEVEDEDDDGDEGAEDPVEVRYYSYGLLLLHRLEGS
jgi:hypothetical protein